MNSRRLFIKSSTHWSSPPYQRRAYGQGMFRMSFFDVFDSVNDGAIALTSVYEQMLPRSPFDWSMTLLAANMFVHSYISVIVP